MTAPSLTIATAAPVYCALARSEAKNRSRNALACSASSAGFSTDDWSAETAPASPPAPSASAGPASPCAASACAVPAGSASAGAARTGWPENTISSAKTSRPTRRKDPSGVKNPNLRSIILLLSRSVKKPSITDTDHARFRFIFFSQRGQDGRGTGILQLTIAGRSSYVTGECLGRRSAMERFLKEVARGKRGARDLILDEAREAARLIVDGNATPAQIGAFLVAERIKTESEEEILAFAEALREKARRLADFGHEGKAGPGTGIDCAGPYNGRRNTFFASWPAAFVL